MYPKGYRLLSLHELCLLANSRQMLVLARLFNNGVLPPFSLFLLYIFFCLHFVDTYYSLGVDLQIGSIPGHNSIPLFMHSPIPRVFGVNPTPQQRDNGSLSYLTFRLCMQPSG